MKKLILLLLIGFSISALQAQSLFVGAKGGLNFGSTGDLTTILNITNNEIINGDDRVGFHIGGHARLQFGKVYVLGETVFTRLTTGFDGDGGDADYTLSKIDTPILFGVRIIGPLSINAGPSFQFIIDNDLDIDGLSDIDLSDPENQLTVGFQAGARLQLAKFGVDLRYEGFFGDNQSIVSVEDITGFAVDSRPTQIVLSVSYDFLDLLKFFKGGSK